MNRTNVCSMQHIHEILGSTLIAGRCDDPHNHRFATMPGEVIPYMGDRVHRVAFLIDSYDGHFRESSGTSSPAIPVGDGGHIHFAETRMTFQDGHTHEFRVSSLINNPIDRC